MAPGVDGRRASVFNRRHRPPGRRPGASPPRPPAQSAMSTPAMLRGEVEELLALLASVLGVGRRRRFHCAGFVLAEIFGQMAL